MAKGLRYLVALQKRKSFLEKAGVTENDFFIASFPKSGNTWLRYLLAHALFPNEEISQSTISNFMPSVYDQNFNLRNQDNQSNQLNQHFIKTHEAFFSLYPKTIYIVRDYRDVVVSAFHYLEKKNAIHKTISDFIRSEQLNAFGAWNWHVGTALEWKEKYPEKILILKYESLLHSPEKEFQTVLDFCNIKPKQQISEIIKSASFGNLRKKEESETISDQPFFFRKGIAGDWKNELSEADVAFLLKDKKTEEIMIRLEYL